MIPAMMMAGKTALPYTNSVNMLTQPYGSNPYETYQVWTVPSGVTTVWIFAYGRGGYAQGGSAGYVNGILTAAGAGGGGGGAEFVKYTVTPGNLLGVQFSSGDDVYTLMNLTTFTTVCTVGNGKDTGGGAPAPPGAGGSAQFFIGATYFANGGTPNSAGAGGAGGYTAVPAGGFVYGGGAGGAGNTLYPSLVTGYPGGASGHPSYQTGVNTNIVGSTGSPGNSRGYGGRWFQTSSTTYTTSQPAPAVFTLYYNV